MKEIHEKYNSSGIQGIKYIEFKWTNSFIYLFIKYLNYINIIYYLYIVFSVHPGVVRTPLYKYDFLSSVFVSYFPIICKTPKNGSLSSVFLALEKSENLISGQYYFDCSIVPYNPLLDDKETRNKLMKYTESLNM